MSPEELEIFKQWGKPLPTRDPHGVDSASDPISSHLEKLTPINWRLEGNKLIADTEMGQLINYIPTDLIMTGVDDAGLPTFKKVVL